MESLVGPVLLTRDPRVYHIVSAMRDANPALRIVVADQGDCLAVRASGRLEITLDHLSWHLGAEFSMRAFLEMMCDFSGHMALSAERIVWTTDAIKSNLPDGA